MNCNIVVVGAGPAGLSFARSLNNSGLNITMVERQSRDELANPAYDGRDIALTHQSVRTLKKLGVWDSIPSEEISLIKEARVVDGNSPYCLSFEVENDPIEALGYIVSNHLLRKALYQMTLPLDNVEILSETSVESVRTDDEEACVVLSNGETIKASLVVAADSRFSETRRMMGIAASMHDFGRVCIVCQMAHEYSHNGIAHECFHYGRTLAVLPLAGKKSSIVVTAPSDVGQTLMDMEDGVFAGDIQGRFGDGLGKMTLVSKRHAYPLVAVHAKKFVAKRFALIGDAAVGMHPVTAHGFNLGLSGQNILACEILQACTQGKDIGHPSVLSKYERQHMRATRPMYIGTNEIVKLFTNDALPNRLLRSVVLRVANNFPLVKWIIKDRLTELNGSRKRFA